MDRFQRNDIVKFYFHCGLAYDEIVALLAKHHDIVISLRNFKRLLRDMSLFRRKSYTDDMTLVEFILTALNTSGQCHGYRWMHMKCLQHGMTVKRETVRTILKSLDPVGVYLRRKRRLTRRQYITKGPNSLWHIDGYDKLTPYGICISGCIDGFSRELIWLKAGTTNSDSRIIAGYFIEAVVSHGGTAVTVRGDFGTENARVAKMQRFLREPDDGDNKHAFLYGTSQHNQRIESWWSILRRENITFWLWFLGQLKADGNFDGTLLDKSLIQFCFLSIIKEELSGLKSVWNNHLIRATSQTIGGRPTILYNFPEIVDSMDYLCEVDPERVEACIDECSFTSHITCDKDIYKLSHIIMTANGWSSPSDAFEGATLYINLRNSIKNSL